MVEVESRVMGGLLGVAAGDTLGDDRWPVVGPSSAMS